MPTIQTTLDEELLAKVDEAVARLGTNRAAFTRQALADSVACLRERELDARHRAGYERYPVEPGEFSDWVEEQVWPD